MKNECIQIDPRAAGEAIDDFYSSSALTLDDDGNGQWQWTPDTARRSRQEDGKR